MQLQNLKSKLFFISILLTISFVISCDKETTEINEEPEDKITLNSVDMLTPAYYKSETDISFVKEINNFVSFVQQEEIFHNPLENELGEKPGFLIPSFGAFGAEKGTAAQHHAAVDIHVGNDFTKVNLYAAHDGIVTTFKDADKYRHYIAISKDIIQNSVKIGKLVTLYAHVDLDLDETEGLEMNNLQVTKGELLSKNLYSGTLGGPHLHFEIRYYRTDDIGDETFYGYVNSTVGLSVPSAGIWQYGVWNPSVGYGFANPKSHGLNF